MRRPPYRLRKEGTRRRRRKRRMMRGHWRRSKGRSRAAGRGPQWASTCAH
jgi:hypothetical protein